MDARKEEVGNIARSLKLTPPNTQDLSCTEKLPDSPVIVPARPPSSSPIWPPDNAEELFDYINGAPLEFSVSPNVSPVPNETESKAAVSLPSCGLASGVQSVAEPVAVRANIVVSEIIMDGQLKPKVGIIQPHFPYEIGLTGTTEYYFNDLPFNAEDIEVQDTLMGRLPHIRSFAKECGLGIGICDCIRCKHIPEYRGFETVLQIEHLTFKCKMATEKNLKRPLLCNF